MAIRSEVADADRSFRLCSWRRLSAGAIKRSGSCRDTHTYAGRQTYSNRSRTHGSDAALPECAASDFGVFTFVDVLTHGRIFGIADLYRTVVDVDLGGFPATVVVICVVVLIPLGSANRSDGVGRIDFEGRGTSAHRAQYHGMQIAVQQPDLARRTDAIDEDALVDGDGRGCAKL